MTPGLKADPADSAVRAPPAHQTAGMGCAFNFIQPFMKTFTEQTIADELEPNEVDRFSASLAPINRTRALSFGLLERFCCFSLLVTAMMAMRIFLAK